MTNAPKADLPAQHSEDPKATTRLYGSSPSGRSGLPQGETDALSAQARQALGDLAVKYFAESPERFQRAHALAIEAYRQGAREAQHNPETLAFFSGEQLYAELEKRQIRPPGERLLLNAYGRECHELGKAEGAREAIARCAQWQPIETAPAETEVLFWVVPKLPHEAPCDTSGHSIFSIHAPRLFRGKARTWSSLEKATHWMPLPNPPNFESRSLDGDGQKVLAEGVGSGRAASSPQPLRPAGSEPADSHTKALAQAKAEGAREAIARWQPIETAPKDGTRILCYLPPTELTDFVPCILSWGCDDENDREAWIDWEDFAPDPPPTHWMPLPDPPSPDYTLANSLAPMREGHESKPAGAE